MENLSQKNKLLELLSDGLGHNTDEIITFCYPSEGRVKTSARYGGRLDDLRKMGYVILRGEPDTEIKGVFWFKIIGKVDRIYKAEEGIPPDMRQVSFFVSANNLKRKTQDEFPPRLFPEPKREINYRNLPK